MKILKVVGFLSLFSSAVICQDWSPFPLGAVMHFSSGNQYQKVYLDSSKMSGDTIFYFYSNTLVFSDTCIIDLDTIPLGAMNRPIVAEYSVLGDTVFAGISKTKFLPFSGKNETWEDDNYSFKVIELTEEVILGQLDSIKYFTITNKGTKSTDTFRLSKHFGCLELMPFLQTPLVQMMPPGKLIGYEDDNVQLGFRDLEFQEYFQFSEGDVFFYEMGGIYSNNFGYQKYPDLVYKDSITELLITPDSIYYKYWRTEDVTLKESQGDTTYYAPLQNLSHVLAYGYITFPSGSPSLLENRVWQKNGASMKCLESTIYILDCQIYDQHDVREGFGFYTPECNYFYRGYLIYNISTIGRYTDIIGWVINGKDSGITKLPMGIKENQLVKTSVYPNPTTGIVNIKTGTPQSLSLQLLDATGRVLYKEEFSNSTSLNLSTFKSGMYFLILQNNSGIVKIDKLVLE
ncbi:MAG: T9SS type A sorting domain-containing protein [Bacteroidia bacterium]